MTSEVLAKKLEEVAKLKREKDAADEAAATLESQYKLASYELLAIMELSEISSLKAHGFTFYIEDKESVKTPKDFESKQALFEFLKEKGIYDDYITINSQSLNSLYKSLAEEALTQGILEFHLPGVEPPTSYKTLKLRKGKD